MPRAPTSGCSAPSAKAPPRAPRSWCRHRGPATRRNARCRATTSASTSRSTPSTSATGGVRSPTRRRCSPAREASPAPSKTCGSTPITPRCCVNCAPRSNEPLAWGIDVTHLAPHLTAITLRPEFFDVYLELAVEFALPIRLPSTVSAEQAGFPFRRLADDEGIVFPDHFDHDWRAGSADGCTRRSRALEPGVTEIHVQPAIDTPGGPRPRRVHPRLDRRPRPDHERRPALTARGQRCGPDRLPSAARRHARPADPHERFRRRRRAPRSRRLRRRTSTRRAPRRCGRTP